MRVRAHEGSVFHRLHTPPALAALPPAVFPRTLLRRALPGLRGRTLTAWGRGLGDGCGLGGADATLGHLGQVRAGAEVGMSPGGTQVRVTSLSYFPPVPACPPPVTAMLGSLLSFSVPRGRARASHGWCPHRVLPRTLWGRHLSLFFR